VFALDELQEQLSWSSSPADGSKCPDVTQLRTGEVRTLQANGQDHLNILDQGSEGGDGTEGQSLGWPDLGTGDREIMEEVEQNAA